MIKHAVRPALVVVALLFLAGMGLVILENAAVESLAHTSRSTSAFFSAHHWHFTALRVGVGLAVFAYWRKGLYRLTSYRGEELEALVVIRNRVFVNLLILELLLNQNVLALLWRM